MLINGAVLHAVTRSMREGKSNIRRSARQPVETDTACSRNARCRWHRTLMFSRSRYEKAASALSKVSRDVLSCQSKIDTAVSLKPLRLSLLLHVIAKWRTTRDKTRRRVMGGGGKGGRRLSESFRRMELIDFSGELNFQHHCANRYLASLRT